MKLYYSPGACSLSPHIVANELGIPLELIKVDLKNHNVEKSGQDYYHISPKGSVPALEMNEGALLTEGPAIVQYLGDQRPNMGLVPPAGTVERYRLQEMLNFISSEIHKNYSPLFNPNISPEESTKRKSDLIKRYRHIETCLSKQKFLLGETFSAADAYLFTVTNWAKKMGVALSDFPNLMAFQQNVSTRPAVVAAMREEGLI